MPGRFVTITLHVKKMKRKRREKKRKERRKEKKRDERKVVRERHISIYIHIEREGQ